VKHFRALGFIAALLVAYATHAQTAVVQSVENVANKVQTFAATSTFTLAATPTVIWELTGSATRTVYVKSVGITCTQTTAGVANAQLIKYSTAATGGTPVAITETPLDSSNAANTAVARHFTANPTAGTPVGSVAIQHIGLPAPASVVISLPSTMLYGAGDPSQYIVLRGVAQNIAIHMAGATLTGSICSVTSVWMEK